MNERIRQLAVQAFFDETTSQPSDKMYTFSDHKMEKFAELIIKECDRYIAERFDETEPWMSPGDLLKHFGVE